MKLTNGLIHNLVKKALLEHLLDEADPMQHFNERFAEVVGDIVTIQIPENIYIPSVPKEAQNDWIIEQIKAAIKTKVDGVINKDYPIGGSCVVVPLGMIKVQPIKGNPTNVLVTAKRKEGYMSGISYYCTVYDNRIPTIVLADPKIPNNATVNTQLIAHMENTIKGRYKVNRDKSFVDKTFMDNIVIQLSNFKG